jgi:hypothetical protein
MGKYLYKTNFAFLIVFFFLSFFGIDSITNFDPFLVYKSWFYLHLFALVLLCMVFCPLRHRRETSPRYTNCGSCFIIFPQIFNAAKYNTTSSLNPRHYHVIFHKLVAKPFVASPPLSVCLVLRR